MKKMIIIGIILLIVAIAIVLVISLNSASRRILLLDAGPVLFGSERDAIKAQFGDPAEIEAQAGHQQEKWSYKDVSLCGDLAEVQFCFSNKDHKMVRFRTFLSVNTEQEANAKRNGIEQFLYKQFRGTLLHVRKAPIPDGVRITVGNTVYELAIGQHSDSEKWYVAIQAIYKDGT